MIPLSGLSNPLEGALLLLLLPVAGLKNPLGGHNNLLERANRYTWEGILHLQPGDGNGTVGTLWTQFRW